jgi:hypothetical protein
MNVAVITPYYRESDAKVRRCMASVAAQTHPATHFMVADGFPKDFLSVAAGVRHVVLPQPHGDNGNTPRGCGRPARRAVSRRARADEKNPALSVDRKLFGTSTIGSHPARSAPAVAPHDPPRSADACRSAIGRPILES